MAGAAARGDARARRATTEALLAVLKKHRIQAVAFVIAGNVKTPDDEAILQRWLDEGHEIGSHSNTHPSYTALTSEAYLADVAASRTTLSAWLTPRQRTLRLVPLPVPAGRRHTAEGRGDPRRALRRRPAQRAGHARRHGLVVRSALGRRRRRRRRRRDRRGAAGLSRRDSGRGDAHGSAGRPAARTPHAAGAADPRQRRRCGQLGRDVHLAGRTRPPLRDGRRGAGRRDLPRSAHRSGAAGATGTTTAWLDCARPRRRAPRSPRCWRRRRRRGTAATSRRSAPSTRPTRPTRRRPG